MTREAEALGYINSRRCFKSPTKIVASNVEINFWCARHRKRVEKARVCKLSLASFEVDAFF